MCRATQSAAPHTVPWRVNNRCQHSYKPKYWHHPNRQLLGEPGEPLPPLWPPNHIAHAQRLAVLAWHDRQPQPRVSETYNDILGKTRINAMMLQRPVCRTHCSQGAGCAMHLRGVPPPVPPRHPLPRSTPTVRCSSSFSACHTVLPCTTLNEHYAIQAVCSIATRFLGPQPAPMTH